MYICENFKTDLEKVSSVKQRMKIVQAFDAHLDAQMAERQRYYANRHHARMYPEEAMSVILDGMTQYTTQIYLTLFEVLLRIYPGHVMVYMCLELWCMV